MATEVTAHLKNLRLAPRKVRLVAALLTGLPLHQALSELEFRAKRAARPLHKLLRSAAADAEHNFKLAKDDLVVKGIVVNSAPTLKRYTPRAFGRAAPIRKRASHVTVTLISRTGVRVSPERGAEQSASAEPSGSASSTVKPSTSSGREAVESPRPKTIGRFTRRFFHRKTG